MPYHKLFSKEHIREDSLKAVDCALFAYFVKRSRVSRSARCGDKTRVGTKCDPGRVHCSSLCIQCGASGELSQEEICKLPGDWGEGGAEQSQLLPAPADSRYTQLNS